MAITKIPAPKNNEAQFEPLQEENRRQARIAADALGSAFVWEKSAEGGPFWGAVYQRLTRLAKGEEGLK